MLRDRPSDVRKVYRLPHPFALIEMSRRSESADLAARLRGSNFGDLHACSIETQALVGGSDSHVVRPANNKWMVLPETTTPSGFQCYYICCGQCLAQIRHDSIFIYLRRRGQALFGDRQSVRFKEAIDARKGERLRSRSQPPDCVLPRRRAHVLHEGKPVDSFFAIGSKRTNHSANWAQRFARRL